MSYLKFFTIFIFSTAIFAEPGDKNDFLSAWEKIQSSNSQVESFEKIDELKYKIKFSSLPYEGELAIVAYDVEEFNYSPVGESDYNKTGYVEIDLPDALEELAVKYSRTYYKWAESNTLYFNQKTQQWVTQKQYNEYLMSDENAVNFGGLFWLWEYWDYLLALIILYFVVSSVLGNKKIKESLDLQKESVEQANELSKASMDAIEKSLSQHERTNELLAELIEEVKKQKD